MTSPPCSDGKKDNDETDVDCGGATCGKCAVGKTCAQASDCASSLVCTPGHVCVAVSCTDGVLDEGETAIDCGGPNCGPCADGKACTVYTDCTSKVCKGGTNQDVTEFGDAGADASSEAGAPDGGAAGVCAPSVTVATITPAVGSTTGGLSVTITGTNFSSSTQFAIDNQPLTGISIVSATQATGITAGYPGHAGTFDVEALDFGVTGTLPKGFKYFFGAPSFAAAVPYAATESYDVVSGNFDADKKLDIIVANYGTNTAALWLGNGDGTFNAGTGIDFGASLLFLKAADLDGDGDLDLVGAEFLGTNVIVVLNNGDGTFAAPVTYPVGGEAAGIAIGDFDGKNKVDIVSTGYQTGTYSILLNNGDGTFGTATTTPTSTSSLLDVVVGYVDGDKNLDLVFTDYANSSGTGITVAIGNGDGTFKTEVNYGTNPQYFHGSGGDLNGDGYLDFVAGSLGTGADVFMNNGDGTFAAPVNVPCGGSADAKLADIDLDGVLDLVCVNYTATQIQFAIGKGDGTFGTPVPVGTTGTEPLAATFGDFDGNGTADVATSSFAGTMSVFLNNSQ